MRHTDELLIEKFQKLGDVEALTHLVDRYFERAFLYFKSRGMQEVDIEDTVQSVFLKLIRHINNGKKFQAFEHYFSVCCRNAWNDYLRRKGLRQGTISIETPAGVNRVDLLAADRWAGDELMPVSLEVLEKAVASCLSQFSDKVALIMDDYVKGYTLKEIAARNQCPENTAASTWHRKKQLLFDCVQQRLGR